MSVPRASTTSDVFNAVAEPRRRQLIDLLSVGTPHDVTELTLRLGLPQPAVSKHLAVLRQVGLVDVVKSGQRRLYTLSPMHLKMIHDWIHPLAHLWASHLSAIKAAAEAEQASASKSKQKTL